MLITFKASTSNVYCQRPSCQRPYMQSQFSLCISCCLKMQDFYKNVCFCTRTRSFVVLCIMVAPLLWTRYVADTNSALKLSQLSATGLQTLLCRVHSSHQPEIQSFVCQYRGASCTYCLGTMWSVLVGKNDETVN